MVRYHSSNGKGFINNKSNPMAFLKSYLFFLLLFFGDQKLPHFTVSLLHKYFLEQGSMCGLGD